MTQTALDFLSTRRSVTPKLLRAPAPDRATLEGLLALACRVPDHGMLVPWRFIVLEEPALRRIGAEIGRIGATSDRDPAALTKAAAIYGTSPLAVAVVHVQRESAKIPAVEQLLSAGNVCLTLLNAALASGWAAGWITGWATHDRAFLPTILQLAANERVAGMIHIGTGPVPRERARPDPAAITTTLTA